VDDSQDDADSAAKALTPYPGEVARTTEDTESSRNTHESVSLKLLGSARGLKAMEKEDLEAASMHWLAWLKTQFEILQGFNGPTMYEDVIHQWVQLDGLLGHPVKQVRYCE
jgi:hypothetical protein